MLIRIPLVVAVLALAASPAHADVFRCGKTFMTFQATDDHLGKHEGVTVRKSDVLRVFGPKGRENIPAYLMLKPLTPEGQPQFAFLDGATHVRVIECLD